MKLRATLAALLLPLSALAAPVLETGPVNIAAVLAQDALKTGPQPYRFAVPVPVAVTPLSHGTWQTGADGRSVWTLRVKSAGASSLNFGFTRFSLPAGAELRLRSLDGRDARGPYGTAHNRLGQLWTPVLRGEEALIELSLPTPARPALVLELGQVNHGFRGFGAKDTVQAKSGDCNIDVVCGDGDEWRNEQRSVARYTIGGLLLCTGQLVNNTAEDFTPYFLTANHCVTTAPQAPTTVYYWNYETSTCGGTPDGSLEQTQSGALFLSGSNDSATVASDFTLMQLLETPDPAFKVYYSGWDNRDLAPLGVTGIHHPSGDEKRISHDFDQTFITAYGEEPDSPLSAATPTHIMVVTWDRGVTEGGSSGSGIWNTEHRLVGQLSGGGSSCTAQDAPDWYGSMHANFFNVPSPTTSLGFWLDPDSTGAETLDGADPNGIDLSVPPPAATGGSSAPPSSGGSSSARDDTRGGALGGLGLLVLLAALRRRGA